MTITVENEAEIYKYKPLPEPVPITEQVWPEETLPLVHIRTMTYMHENYIRDCIEGILMQKTTFPVQVLIHDDASTDLTADIVREYEQKYPHLIRAFYQEKNTYSIKDKTEKRVLRQTFMSWRTGKYEALCEGDDFWTDPMKLQKQITHLLNNPDTSVCVHGADILDASTGKFAGTIMPCKGNKIFIVEEIIKGGGGLFATNSMVFPTRYRENLPAFYHISPVGDYPLMINFALRGKVFFMGEIMSTYRECVPGSWSLKFIENNAIQIKHWMKINEMLDELNGYTNYDYDLSIQMTKTKNDYHVYLLERRLTQIKWKEFKKYFHALPLKTLITRPLLIYHPRLYKFLRMKLIRIAG